MKKIYLITFLLFLHSCLNSSGKKNSSNTTNNVLKSEELVIIPMKITPQEKQWTNTPLFSLGETQNFTITNLGEETINNCQEAKLEGAHPNSFIIEKDSCLDISLEKNKSCSIIVRPRPQLLGLNYTELRRYCYIGGTVMTIENGLSVEGVANSKPQLISFDPLTGGFEDQEFSIDYFSLLNFATYNEYDSNQIVNIKIEELYQGELYLNGSLVELFPIIIGPFDFISWVPVLNSNGVIKAFSIRLSDSFDDSVAIKDVNIELASIEDYPVIHLNSPLIAQEGSSNNIIGNDSHINISDVESNSQEISLTLISVPSYGLLKNQTTTLLVGDTFTMEDVENSYINYTHDGSENFSDSFIFTVSDGVNTTINKTFNIFINKVNDIPVLVNTGITVLEDTNSNAISTVNLSMSDEEQGNSLLVFKITSTPSYGTLKNGTTELTVNDTFTVSDIANSLITYSNSGEATSDSFGFTYSDGFYTSSINLFSITVTPVNDNPTISKNLVFTVNEGSSTNILTNLYLKVIDNDNSNDQLMFTVTSLPSNGTLNGLTGGSTFTQQDIDNSLISYTHDSSETITDSFVFYYEDLISGTQGNFTFSIVVIPQNDRPSVGADQNIDAAMNVTTSITFSTGSDTEGNILAYYIVTNPSNGTLSNCTLTTVYTCNYTPNSGFYGSDSFTYKVNDAGGNISGDSLTVATITVSVQLVQVAETLSLTALSNPYYLIFHPYADLIYIDNNTTNEIIPYSLDTVSSSLTQATARPLVGSDPQKITISNDGLNLYIASFNTGSIEAYDINLATGNLTYNESEVLLATKSVTTSFDGRYVYAVSISTDDVVLFSRDLSTGAISNDAQYAAGIVDPIHIVLHPQGHYAYVPSSTSSGIYYYTRNISTGALSYVGLVSGTDGLESISSIEISKDGKHLYTACGGTHDKIGVYSIDQATGGLTFLEFQGNTVGDFDELSISNDGLWLTVSSFANAKILIYKRDPQSGLLTSNSEINQSGFGLAFSPDDSYFAYTTKTNDTFILNKFMPGTKVNTLSLVEEFTIGPENIKDIAIDSLGRTLYLTVSGPSTGDNSFIYLYLRDLTTGQLTFSQSYATTTSMADKILLSEDGLHVYISHPEEDSVSYFTRDIDTGALSGEVIYVNNNSTYDGIAPIYNMKFSGDGQYIYIAGDAPGENNQQGALSVWSRDLGTGAMTLVENHDQVNDLIAGAGSVCVSKDNKHVYASAKGEDYSIVYYTRDKTTGALSLRATFYTSYIEQANDLAITNNGKYIYVTSPANNSIVALSRNESNGALTYYRKYVNNTYQGQSFINGMISPQKVLISQDQKTLYVIAQSSITVFSINTKTGNLTFVRTYTNDQTTDWNNFEYIYSITISPDGRFLYSSSYTDEDRSSGIGVLKVWQRE